MDQAQDSHHEFSHNQFSVSSGHVRVQYGNNYEGKSHVYLSSKMLIYHTSVTPTPEISWGDITRWIFDAGSIFSQRDFHRSLQKRRVESSTGSWFLKGKTFDNWVKEPSSFLWLRGKSLDTSMNPNFIDLSDLSCSRVW